MNAVVKTRPAGTGGLEEAPGRLLGGGGRGERVEIRKGVHEAWKQRGRRKARSWRFWDDNECQGIRPPDSAGHRGSEADTDLTSPWCRNGAGCGQVCQQRARLGSCQGHPGRTGPLEPKPR